MRWLPVLLLLLLLPACGSDRAGCPGGGTAEVVTIAAGDLVVEIADNGGSQATLSGIQSLRHASGAEATSSAACENAAGNYEHVHAIGHSDPRNWMAPRSGPLELVQIDAQTAVLERAAADSPWGVEASLAYQVVPPHYVDLFFQCRFAEPEAFEPGGALFFFASYLAGVSDPGLHFLADAGGRSTWKRAGGEGSYRGLGSAPLDFPPGHDSAVNLTAHDAPLIAEPFYYVHLGDMVYAVLFDRLVEPADEIRFATFRGKAWDWSYVVHDVAAGCGFAARVIYKPWVSAGDVEDEYRSWEG